MKTISVTDIQTNLTNTLKESGGEPMVITENDRPIAVISSVLDPEDLERLILAHNPRFNRLIDSANRSIQETGGVKHDDFWSSL